MKKKENNKTKTERPATLFSNFRELTEKQRKEIQKNIQESMKKDYEEREKQKQEEHRRRTTCRFCFGRCRALNNNGIYGPGYAEWNYACVDCGKFQG